jgi:hypothetical protein
VEYCIRPHVGIVLGRRRSDLAVITFLVVTSIINMAAGYALAVYLRAGSVSAGTGSMEESSRAENHSTLGAGYATTLNPQPIPASTFSMSAPSTSPVPSGQDVTPAAAPTFHAEPLASEPDTLRTDVDQDLLAGIEEFRNQLAQLKSKGGNDGVPVGVVGAV